jgi:predicted transcriptional regulator
VVANELLSSASDGDPEFVPITGDESPKDTVSDSEILDTAEPGIGHNSFHCGVVNTDTKCCFLKNHIKEHEVKLIRDTTDSRNGLQFTDQLTVMGDCRHTVALDETAVTGEAQVDAAVVPPVMNSRNDVLNGWHSNSAISTLKGILKDKSIRMKNMVIDNLMKKIFEDEIYYCYSDTDGEENGVCGSDMCSSGSDEPVSQQYQPQLSDFDSDCETYSATGNDEFSHHDPQPETVEHEESGSIKFVAECPQQGQIASSFWDEEPCDGLSDSDVGYDEISDHDEEQENNLVLPDLVKDHDNHKKTMTKQQKTGVESKKRCYDKVLACFFCKKLLKMKMKRHLVTVHKTEPEVVHILKLPDLKQREIEFARLVNRGNFLHNTEVLQNGTGSLIVGRRRNRHCEPQEYLPCIHCQAMFLCHDLYRHVRSCKFGPIVASCPGSTEEHSEENAKKKVVLSEARLFLHGAVQSDDSAIPKKFQREILTSLREDDLGKIVKNDYIILQFGISLHRRLGKNRANDICQKMRQLARLVQEVNSQLAQKKNNAPHLELFDCLKGEKFNLIAEATRNLCGYYDDPSGRPMFRNPSLGLKLGHHLVKCAEIKRGMAVRCGDQLMKQHAEAFLDCHKQDWINYVSSASLATFKLRKYNTPDELPLTSDLVKLKDYLDLCMKALTAKISDSPDTAVWRALSEVIYTRVVIFNKRRPGETAKLLLSAFTNRPKWEQVANDQIVSSLEPLEKKLLKRYMSTVFQLFGHEVIIESNISTVQNLLTPICSHNLLLG